MPNIKVIEPDVYTNEDVVARLERLLELAKSGNLTDYMMVYYQDREPGFSHSYRSFKKDGLVGLMMIMISNFCLAQYELEGQE